LCGGVIVRQRQICSLFFLFVSVSCFAVILVSVGEVINGIGEEIMMKARD
jgi:hypothetical protein